MIQSRTTGISDPVHSAADIVAVICANEISQVWLQQHGVIAEVFHTLVPRVPLFGDGDGGVCPLQQCRVNHKRILILFASLI